MDAHKYSIVPARAYKLLQEGKIEEHHLTTLGALCLYSNPDGSGMAFPSQTRLGKIVRKSRQTINEHCGVLESVGLIRRQWRWNRDGMRTSNEYEVVYDDEYSVFDDDIPVVVSMGDNVTDTPVTTLSGLEATSVVGSEATSVVGSRDDSNDSSNDSSNDGVEVETFVSPVLSFEDSYDIDDIVEDYGSEEEEEIPVLSEFDLIDNAIRTGQKLYLSPAQKEAYERQKEQSKQSTTERQ